MAETFRLSERERKAARNLLIQIASNKRNLEESAFLERAAVYAHGLPLRLREAFYDFKIRENVPYLLLTNNPVFPADVGPTPQTHWQPGQSRPLNLPQLMHGLYSSLLGEPFGFETQQCGRIFNDLIAIEGQPPNSSSGAGKIGLHTEDCAYPFMPDYLGLLCLRNETHATTLVSSLSRIEIPEDIRDSLFREVWVDSGSAARDRVDKRFMLFGDPARPYLRYGLFNRDQCSDAALRAVRFVSAALQRVQESIVLNQGDCLYLDNFVAVHGRAPYEAVYGTRARWFCRLVMVRDLRRTRVFRVAPEARVMLKHTY